MSFPKYLIVTVVLAGLTTYLLAPAAVEDRINEFTGVTESCPEELNGFLQDQVETVNDSNVDARLERSNTSQFATSTRNLRCQQGNEQGQNIDHYYCTPTTEDLIVDYTEIDEEGNIIAQKELLLNNIELDENQAYTGHSCEVAS